MWHCVIGAIKSGKAYTAPITQLGTSVVVKKLVKICVSLALLNKNI